MKQINETNEMIAIFMGLEKFEARYAHNNTYGGFDFYSEPEEVWVLNPTEEFKEHLVLENPEEVGLDVDFKLFDDYYFTLKYHISWDWLIPVIRKIYDISKDLEVESAENITFADTFHPDYMFIEFLQNDIDHIYKRVTIFIEWYNEKYKKN